MKYSGILFDLFKFVHVFMTWLTLEMDKKVYMIYLYIVESERQVVEADMGNVKGPLSIPM